jgi:hypothetical protein
MPSSRSFGLWASLVLSTSVLSAFAGCAAAGNAQGTTGSGGDATTGTTGSGGGATTTTATSTTSGTGGSATTTTTTTSTTSGAGGSGGAGGAIGAGGQGGSGGIVDLDAGADAADAEPPPPPDAEVYAHSPDTLYKLDPITQQVTTVGAFSGCDSSVIDIALDKNGLMFGTTFSGLYTINKNSAVCSLISFGAYPNSLSFVPAGTVDPQKEALVGYVGSTYVRINTSTGVVTNIGGLGPGGYASSGDMVSIIGGGSYLTVTGDKCADCIVEVNPKTGALMNVIGALGHSAVYGLAYWAGLAYGFDNAGELFQIDVTTGTSTVIPIPNAPAGLQFWGAGSTTAAPHQ